MKFTIEKDEVLKCLKFASEAWGRNTQSRKHFGGKKRGKNEFLADQIEGKLAELILKKFLQSKGVAVNLDFNHYEGEHNTDDGDFSVLLNNKLVNKKIDIKGSSQYAQWLLVENHKFFDINTNAIKSEAFIKVRFGEQFPGNKALRKNPKILLNKKLSGEVVGWAKAEDFFEDIDSKIFWFVWKKGDRPWHERVLPDSPPKHNEALKKYLEASIFDAKKGGKKTNISVPLDAEINYGLPIKWLRTDWDELISFILEKPCQKEGFSFNKKTAFPDYDAFNITEPPRYSFVFAAKADEITDEQKQCLQQMLYEGIKVILLTTDEQGLVSQDKDKSGFSIEEQDRFKDCNLLSIHIIDKNYTLDNPFYIIDGKRDIELLERESKKFPSFNFMQYEIEHAPADEHIAAKAGAGTGKTMTMVQRVICLLQRENIKPSEIAMITFTRDSSKEMFSRLRKELFKRYDLTKKTNYLTYIEELKRMKISTIHSFAKMLLKETGSSLGFGREMQIRTFIQDRKNIIEKSFEEYMLANPCPIKTIEEKIYPLQLYELIDLINDFWMEMEKKGMTADDIKHLEWGTAGRKSDFFNNLFKEIYPKIEKDFQIFKQEQNAVSVNDLTRQVDLAINRSDGDENPLNKLPLSFKYLFVDEFQDSDDVQIRLIAQLQRALNVTIFAVGDIKQSIYRFRGADHTAFDRLGKELEDTGQFIRNKVLKINYRTTEKLLNRMHPYFKKWGENGWLDYTDNDRLIGIRKMPSGLQDSPIIFKKIFKEQEQTEHDVIEMIKYAKEQLLLDTESKKEKRKIAALVRTNKEAQLLEYWCEKHDIPTYINIGGTFFNSEAVQDFSILIEALLFPKNTASIVNLLNSPYSKTGIHWTAIAEFNGNEEKIHEYLEKKNLLTEGFPLNKWTSKLRTTPIFSVIREIIKESNVIARFFEFKKRWLMEKKKFSEEKAIQQAEVDMKQYSKNINHLMDLLHQEFDSDFATLYKIYSWLKRNQAANREEDEPLLEEVPEEVVNIITVHRSKGLEYHTVLIPFTARRFRANFSEILFDEDKQKAGWKIRKGEELLTNNLYEDLSEKEEDPAVLKEETRLLYVAMTRSESQLFILQNEYELYPSYKTDTWAKLLRVYNGGSVH